MAGQSYPKQALFAGFPGDEKFYDKATQTNPGSPVELIKATSPENKITYLHNLHFSCMQDGKLQVLIAGQAEPANTGRISQTEKNIPLSWVPGRPISPGVEFSVVFTAADYTPVTDCEVHLQATQVTVVT